MNFHELNPDNWEMFAIKHYYNPTAVTKEDFEEDLKRFKYLKRLFKRYNKSKSLRTHLILNHIIVMYNVFDDAATPLLFYKVEKQYWSMLKAFMRFLDRLPESLNNEVDQRCLEELNLI